MGSEDSRVCPVYSVKVRDLTGSDKCAGNNPFIMIRLQSMASSSRNIAYELFPDTEYKGAGNNQF